MSVFWSMFPTLFRALFPALGSPPLRCYNARANENLSGYWND